MYVCMWTMLLCCVMCLAMFFFSFFFKCMYAPPGMWSRSNTFLIITLFHRLTRSSVLLNYYFINLNLPKLCFLSIILSVLSLHGSFFLHQSQLSNSTAVTAQGGQVMAHYKIHSQSRIVTLSLIYWAVVTWNAHDKINMPQKLSWKYPIIRQKLALVLFLTRL